MSRFRSLQVSAVVRLFLALWLAIAPAYAWAGTLPLLGAGKPAAAGGCSQATSFLARTTYTGSDVTNFTNLICGLVNASSSCSGGTLFSCFDQFYVLATADATNMLVNLVNSTYSASTTGTGVTFTAYRGVLPQAAGTLTTSFTPSTATSPLFTQNSAHLAEWDMTNTSTGAYNYGDGAGVARLYPNFSGTDFYARINEGSSSPYTIANPQGLLVGNRSGASAEQGYQNGASLGSASVASGSVGTQPIQLIANSPFQIAMISSGASLNSTDVSNLYGLLKTYMTAVGVCGVMTCP